MQKSPAFFSHSCLLRCGLCTSLQTRNWKFGKGKIKSGKHITNRKHLCPCLLLSICLPSSHVTFAVTGHAEAQHFSWDHLYQDRRDVRSRQDRGAPITTWALSGSRKPVEQSCFHDRNLVPLHMCRDPGFASLYQQTWIDILSIRDSLNDFRGSQILVRYIADTYFPALTILDNGIHFFRSYG